MQARATAPHPQRPPADEESRFYFFWSGLFLASAALELGLKPGLRGSRMDIDAALDAIGRASSGLSQTVGILTCLLTVHALLRGVRSGPRLDLALARGLLGTFPVLIVMMAHTQPLPPVVLLASATATALVWLLLALEWTRERTPGAAWTWLWVLAWSTRSLSAAAELLDFGPVTAMLATDTARVTALTLVSLLALGAVRGGSRAPWTAVGLLTCALLLGRTITAAGLRDVPFGVVVLGRSFGVLAPTHPLESFAAALGWCTALLWLARRSALGAPAMAAALGLFLPLSPLTAAAFSLLALSLVRWRDGELPRPDRPTVPRSSGRDTGDASGFAGASTS